MGARRRQAGVFGMGTVLLLGVAVVVGLRLFPGAGRGDVDPAGLTVGLVSLVAALWSGWMAVQALRWQETDIAGNADRLAVDVVDAERAAWRHLLGAHDRTINVPFVHRPAPAHEAAGAVPHGTFQDIADYYQRLRPGRLVITGAPGAGKTALALQLVLLLLEHRSPGEAVPVRLSLPSFDTNRPMEEWIARHLVTTYGLSKNAAHALVKDRRVLPVLDGLDEMDADPQPGYDSRAAHALRALNAYQQGVAKAQLILTCRSGSYTTLQAVGAWLHDAARIELTPLDAATAWDFLTDRVDGPDRWQNVLDALAAAPDGPLAAGLSTPWRLTLAATVYEQRAPHTGAYLRHPDALLAPSLNTPDAVGEHLLDLFIPAATALASAPRHRAPYSPDRVRTGLTVLARYLNHNATTNRAVGGQALPSTDIVLAELWPLVGSRPVRAAVAAITTTATLASTAAWLFLDPPFDPLLPTAVGAGIVSLRTWVQPGRTARLSPVLGPMAFGPPPHRFVIGAAAEPLYVLAFSLWITLWLGLLSGLLAGLAAESQLAHAIAVALLFGAIAGGIVGQEGRFVVGLVTGLMFGFACGAYAWFGTFLEFDHLHVTGIMDGIVTLLADALLPGLAIGLVGGLVWGVTSGEAGLWYMALLLCTRQGFGRWLPWRLSRFLDWCSGTGLLRKAGTAYQFRHRELQDFLAHH
ncbi:putative NTPase (NACHT family) [Streptomyces chartreusis NRRL 3882]|uniref:Putative NTPase (NACHT family) n=2 Tax=Streptomyces TaxID=1883 RepID=A0A2N9B6G1_STRCX|nr:putative NTPase (NACHT family) [Streptomyces chartreusis NRRL 3882]